MFFQFHDATCFYHPKFFFFFTPINFFPFSYITLFGLAYQAKDIVVRLIVVYNSLRDFDPYVNRSIYFYMRIIERCYFFWLVLKILFSNSIVCLSVTGGLGTGEGQAWEICQRLGSFQSLSFCRSACLVACSIFSQTNCVLPRHLFLPVTCFL